MSYLVPGKFAFVAHRGGFIDGNEFFPENSCLAFENTLKIIPDAYFELDIHRTKDGEIIVMHDDRVDRTTDGHGAIKDMTWKELSKLNVIGGGKKDKIPLLREIFQRFPQSRISVEFKGIGYEQETIKIIRDAGASDRVVLASFSQRALFEARRLAREMCTGFGNWEGPLMLAAVKTGIKWLVPKQGGVFQIPLSKNGIAVYSKKFLQLAHRFKKHVHLWTINNEATMERLISDGVDGIITDHPRMLFNVARRLGKI